MAKYVFINIPAYGHVNATLPVVQELVRRGETVVYYLTEEFQAVIEATGATFRPYQPFMKPQQPPASVPEGNKAQPGAPGSMLTRGNRDDIYEMLERIREEKPDIIVYDALHLWARAIAEALRIPAALSCPIIVAHEHYNPLKDHLNLLNGQVSLPIPVPPVALERIQAKINEMRAQYNLQPFDMRDFYTHAEPLNIVFMPRAFHPAGALFDERFAFVGPSLFTREDASGLPLDTLKDGQTLYISLGTVFNDRPDFFNLCFEAFGKQPWQVVLSYGTRVDATNLGAAPTNFQLASYVPQLEVLRRSSVFVTHGGMNSVMESLYYGVPMVVIPQQVEQATNAQRVAELGLGVVLDAAHLTAEALAEAVERVHSDPMFLARAQEMQRLVREAGGYQRAADALIEFSRQYIALA